MYGDTVCYGAIKFVMVTNTGVEHFYGLTHPFAKGRVQSVAQSYRFWHINLSRDGNVCRGPPHFRSRGGVPRDKNLGIL